MKNNVFLVGLRYNLVSCYFLRPFVLKGSLIETPTNVGKLECSNIQDFSKFSGFKLATSREHSTTDIYPSIVKEAP